MEDLMSPNLFLVGLMAALTGAHPAPPPKPKIEPIYGLTVTRTGLTVVVPSNGCTRKEDFAARTSGPGRNAVIGFYRRHPDTCRSFAAGHAVLAYGFAELALSPNVKLKVLNEFTADPSPMAMTAPAKTAPTSAPAKTTK
jgi:hypothetical protein